MLARGIDLVERHLAGVGNVQRERLFRLQITLSLQRALTDDEIAVLPGWFHAAPALDILGGPVAILRETEAGAPSTWPCVRPRHLPFPGVKDRDIWMPGDCGTCPSCQARANREKSDGNQHP